MLPVLYGLLALGAVSYVALCVLLVFTQDSALFYPGPNDAMLRGQFEENRVEIQSEGATVEGWWVENPDASRRGS